MKKIYLLALIAISFISCNQEPKGYKITGTTDFEDGTRLILSLRDETNMTSGFKEIDTTVVLNGKFEIKGKVEDLDLYFLREEKTNQMISLILENANIEIQLHKDSIQTSVVKGTFQNDELIKFNKEFTKMQNSLQEFQTVNSEKMQTAIQNNDTVVSNQLKKEYFALRDKMEAFQGDYAKKNNKSFISVLIIKDLLDNPSFSPEEVSDMYKNLDAELKTNKHAKKIEEILENLSKLAIGKKAPDFSAKSPDGNEVSLKSSLGSKVTIIDFWASWCKPCRVENPNMVALYNEFKDSGLSIIGVSLDQEGKLEDWKNAIAQDNLTWYHLSNLKFWQDPIAELYNVKSIPAIFVLDANGIIVAKDIRGEELKNKVKELISK
jgi:peroxiredoxin